MHKLRITAGAALMVLSHWSLAQTNLTLYGTVDTGVEYLTNVTTEGRSLVRMPNLTGSWPSHWGVLGEEDLGDGLKAMFKLESGLALDSGALNHGGRLFGREAWVGVGGKYGAVKLGRQLSMTPYTLFIADVIGQSIYSLASLDPYIPNARMDNTISYVGKFSDFTAGATYSFGRDTANLGSPNPAANNCPGETAGNSKACRQYTLLVKYDAPTFGVAAAYDRMNGGAGSTWPAPPTQTLNKSDYTDSRISLTGYYRYSKGRVGLGWIGRDTDALADTKSAIYFVGADYAMIPSILFAGMVARNKIDNATNDASTMTILRATYFLSKRTSLYVSTAYMVNQNRAATSVSAGGTVGRDAAGNGMNQAGVMAGMRHNF